jgi:phosphoglycolate phosphatase-like HAD superfamily hydrolase
VIPTPLRAVLFDMDGVLVDSYEAWLAVVNHAARRFQAPAIDRARLALLFGQGPEEDARTLFPGNAASAIRAVYDEAMPREVGRIAVGEESHAVLDALADRGIRRAVVTNTQTSLARLILEATGLLGRLDAWAGVGPGLREKPAPDLLEAVLRELGVDRTEALLVGDSRYDEEAARALGMTFVHFDLRAGRGTLRGALSPHLADRH